MDNKSKKTHDHNEIRKWIEDRNGRPSVVTSTNDGDSALLRVDFLEPDDELEEVSWEEFFRIFDENNLDFLYQEETADGNESRFFKFVNRE